MGHKGRERDSDKARISIEHHSKRVDECVIKTIWWGWDNIFKISLCVFGVEYILEVSFSKRDDT